ncbi:P-loop containing nucleoside triphosphate hydrolase protein [Lasiosphaeris hirsuta]|uniref:RNA helicase n=1 Tax=Lasiosphaeris hirsuta TaxID=260670 RepID=A0AA40DWK1_9PEZI|nr:P-loop containing nucleoside triphosphate hydrolase protein [Lasiosphaeris hirsuta]
MPRFRAPSPAFSENEVDIAGDLFADEPEDESIVTKKKAKIAKTPAADLDFRNLLNIADNDASDDGDADYIASHQRASNRSGANVQNKASKKGGGFQAMGLSANVMRAITKKGFSIPTPIQRKTIPLILERRDVVGMARTGSGKTAAFVIPMIERLKGHSPRVGARAIVLSPSRELALQTLKVVKEFGRGTDLKTILLVGGDSLEEQFSLMASNPDIIIATPGRFLHLKVEMSLDLSSVKYAVFDEADRLFEMGFATQLTEILHALPPSRQTLLFSATLPSSLVEFARAGLQDPSLVRLDAETKVSPDLECAFFSVKGGEKEAALLHILHDIIKMPMGSPDGAPTDDTETQSKKRKRVPDRPNPREKPTEHSTIVFTATKHHVEYITNLLRHAGFAVSYAYGSLDQTARKFQVEDFRRGRSNILVVTDVAARGIDIPVLANVINYDFPPQPKIFVHRVGRTARAGQRGWAYGIIGERDLPYVLDLQLFLGRKLLVGQEEKKPNLAQDVVIGALQRVQVEANVEWVGKVLNEHEDIKMLRGVTVKAEKLYLKTRNSASSHSAKRSKEIISSRAWGQLHPLFGVDAAEAEEVRDDLLAKISTFKPNETVFELGPAGKSTRNKAAEVVRSMRTKMKPRKPAAAEDGEAAVVYNSDEDDFGGPSVIKADDDEESKQEAPEEMAWEDDVSSDEELEVTVSKNALSKKGQTSFEDPEFFVSYTPRATNAAEERAYGVHSGSQTVNFLSAARDVAMDLTNDDTAKSFGAPARSKMRWDKKQSKYVERANDEDGSRGAKMIRGESGVKIAASFQSGRFDRWRRANRVGGAPRVGEFEKAGHGHGNAVGGAAAGGVRYKHNMEKAPKDADKYRDDYEVRKKRVAEAKENRVGKYKDGEGSTRELKGATDIRKAREIKEQKRLKNARMPSSSKRGGKR